MMPTSCMPSYAGYRFPAEAISYAVYLWSSSTSSGASFSASSSPMTRCSVSMPDPFSSYGRAGRMIATKRSIKPGRPCGALQQPLSCRRNRTIPSEYLQVRK
jgi:hypothetical protein